MMRPGSPRCSPPSVSCLTYTLRLKFWLRRLLGTRRRLSGSWSCVGTIGSILTLSSLRSRSRRGRSILRRHPSRSVLLRGSELGRGIGGKDAMYKVAVLNCNSQPKETLLGFIQLSYFVLEPPHFLSPCSQFNRGSKVVAFVELSISSCSTKSSIDLRMKENKDGTLSIF